MNYSFIKFILTTHTHTHLNVHTYAPKRGVALRGRVDAQGTKRPIEVEVHALRVPDVQKAVGLGWKSSANLALSQLHTQEENTRRRSGINSKSMINTGDDTYYSKVGIPNGKA